VEQNLHDMQEHNLGTAINLVMELHHGPSKYLYLIQEKHTDYTRYIRCFGNAMTSLEDIYIYICIYTVYNNHLVALFILSLLDYHTSTVSGISTAHHQEVECILVYVANGTYTSTLTDSIIIHRIYNARST
jgi:hypothetical protein